MQHSIYKALIVISSIFTYWANHAVAGQQSSDTQQQLLACQKLEKPEEQLACFNRIASAVKSKNTPPTKPSKSKIEAPSKNKDQKAEAKNSEQPDNNVPDGQKDQNFGLSSDAIAKRDGINNEPETIESEVVKWRRMFNRRFEVTLANGQVWQETSGSKLRFPSNKNLKVTITESWSGGYRMKFAGIKKPAKVKRVQ